MEKRYKLLLLDTLGAMLQHKVCVDVDGKCKVLCGIQSDVGLCFDNSNAFYGWESFNMKPYLRPMSSMTDDEWEEYKDLLYCVKYADNTLLAVNMFNSWLNEHHFDYRGLIDKGLAIEAPKGMYE